MTQAAIWEAHEEVGIALHSIDLERREAHKVSGRERQGKCPETGSVAVLAEHSTGKSGELRPMGPTGGKAMPGITFSWIDRREIL